MRPKEVLKKWIDCFRVSGVAGITALYVDDAVNHQVANALIVEKMPSDFVLLGGFLK